MLQKTNELKPLIRFSPMICVLGLLILGVLFNVVDRSVNNYDLSVSTKNHKKSQKTDLPIRSKKSKKQDEYKFSLEVERTLLSSPRFLLSPDGCIRKIFVNGKEMNLGNYSRRDLCPPRPVFQQKTGVSIDLSSMLIYGKNKVLLNVKTMNNARGLNISQLPSIFFYCGLVFFFVATAITVYSAAGYLGLKGGVQYMLIAALAYFLFWLYSYPNLAFSPDILGHVGYVKHLAKNWFEPYEYWGKEYWHPPLYYYLTALFSTTLNQIMAIEPLSSMRAFSIVLYMIFCTYAVATLRTVVKHENIAYYVGALLIVFWPISVQMASRINSDIGLYPVWAIIFYYLVRWYKDGNLTNLQISICFVGLAFLIKTNAIIPLALVGTTVLYSLWLKRITWQQLLEKKSLISYGVVFFCLLLNSSRLLYIKFFIDKDIVNKYLGGPGSDTPTLNNFTSFDISSYISTPYSLITEETSFLSFFFKSMLHGQKLTKYADIASTMNSLLIAFVLITILATLISLVLKKQKIADLMIYIIAIILPIIAIIAFFIVKHWVVCQDFRFILPMLVPLVILYVRGINSVSCEGWTKPVYWLGIIIGISLPLISIVFYILQGLQFISFGL